MDKTQQELLETELKCIIKGIGGTIKMKRDELGWSTDKLSKESGVSTGAISALENYNNKMPNIYTLVSLAKALGLSSDAFLELLAVKTLNDKKNTDKIKSLDSALLMYGVPYDVLNQVKSYIDFSIFNYITSFELGSERSKKSLGVHYDPTKTAEIKDMLIRFGIPELNKFLESLPK